MALLGSMDLGGIVPSGSSGTETPAALPKS